MKRALAIIIAITLLFSSCNSKTNISQDDSTETTTQTEYNSEKIIATWVYYNEIEEIVSSCNSEEELVNQFNTIVDKLKSFSVNTVIFHVRAFDDAFYKSKLFQVSKYCADDKGDLKFDVLKYFIDVCHSKNIAVWGWVNPYRINKVDDTSTVQKGYYGYNALHSENGELLIHSSNGVYYNPADESVKKHIIDGIREILENYPIDGIHFDDYFYPRTDADIDKGYYSAYLKNGGTLSLADFRRENVNSLVLSACTLVRKYGKVFSISPVSDIQKNISSYYADVKLWATDSSYVDYIMPQIYFGFQNSIQPFEKTLKSWVCLTGDTNKLAIGLALYKSGATESYLTVGKDEWKSRDVISKQIKYINDNYENIGFVYYSASFLYKSIDGGTNTEILNIKNILNE